VIGADRALAHRALALLVLLFVVTQEVRAGADSDLEFATTYTPLAFYLGIVFYGVFRIWEIVDIWVRPAIQNSRFDEIQKRHEKSARIPQLTAEVHHQGAGLALTWRF